MAAQGVAYHSCCSPGIAAAHVPAAAGRDATRWRLALRAAPPAPAAHSSRGRHLAALRVVGLGGDVQNDGHCGHGDGVVIGL